jgi:hypothetical protein
MIIVVIKIINISVLMVKVMIIIINFPIGVIIR